MRRCAAPSGFTLVELLIVLSIMAVLASGSLALLAGRADDARFREAARDLLAACDVARSHAVHRGEVVALRTGDGGASYTLVRILPDGRAAALRGLAGRTRHLGASTRLTLTPLDAGRATPTSVSQEPRWGPTAAADQGWTMRISDSDRQATVVLHARSRLARLSMRGDDAVHAAGAAP